MSKNLLSLVLIYGNAIIFIIFILIILIEKRIEKCISIIPYNFAISCKTSNRKRIAIDIRSIIYQPYGVGKYIASLLEAIYRLRLEEGNEYILFSASRKNKPPLWIVNIAKTSDRFGIYHVRFSTRAATLLMASINLPKVEKLVHQIDILFSPHSLLMPAIEAKKVISIFDLSYFEHPEYKKRFDYYESNIESKATRADHIITISDFSKGRIIELLKIPAEKISVIKGAAGTEFRPINDKSKIDEVIKKYDLESDFIIMYAGDAHERKNLPTLLKAFSILDDKTLNNCKLALLGISKRVLSEIKKNINNIDNRVIPLGYIENREEVALIYNAVKLFVYPSLYEGFGLPILEAMACGVPVITTKFPALKEVAKNAACYLKNPLSYDELSTLIKDLLNNTELWDSYRIKGLERSKYFSWDKSAEDLIKVFDEL